MIIPLVLALALLLPSTIEAQDTIHLKLEVVVDANYPTGIFAQGFPPEMKAEQDQVYTIISWPSTGEDPETSRVPGYVKWKSDDDSVLFHQIDEVTTLVIFTEARDSVVMIAELHPFKKRRVEI